MPKRVDANQREIVKRLREAGATVQHLHMVGKGCPDLLVGFNQRNFLMEVKDPAKPPSARRLTKDEDKWHKNWRGHATVVENADVAIQIILHREVR